MSSFVHLHLHSNFSLLDGANRLPDVIAAAREAGMPALALTDHGNMFGAIAFYREARRAGIKPIVGIEAYTARKGRHDRTPGQAGNNHLILLARNETGFKNLIKLTSRAFLEGFYYKPRMDRELLREHSEGLLCLSACLKGEINQLIMERQEKEAEATACEFREIFGADNFYLEMQDHGIEEQRQTNEILRGISGRTGIPLVVSNDCHYLRQEDWLAHDVLLCIGTQRTLDDPNRLKYASREFYLKNAAEMFALFPDDGEAVENTVAIADRCNLEISNGDFHLPEFPVPAGCNLNDYFEDVARQGLEERLAELRRRGGARHSEEVYRQRLATEIDIIQKMGFPGYFLIVWDFMRYARNEGIPVGPGRGSAAGSLVAYSLRITDIDPLLYDLLFERFLNPERVSMPDIDIDFCMRRRGEVIQYVGEKYGRDRVAQIITFGTLAAKAVIRDVGRVTGVPYAKIDRIAKMIPDMTRSLAEAAREIDSLKAEVETDAEVRKIVEVGVRLEGVPRHASLHAAGVVIAPRPIEELVPLYKTSKDEIVTQWDKDVIESLGLLKMDFLGLRTLTVIDDAVKIVRLENPDFDLDEVPLDDAETFRLFCEARSNGVFQFESQGMKDLLRRAQPTRFEDLAAMNALYRPGALSVGMVEEYIQRKLGRRRVRYILPETQPILEETHGVIAYQEQVMRIAVEVAGFSLGEADLLRKAMGKKSVEVMAQQKEKFVVGAATRGVDKAKAAALWEHIEPFAGYGFNKSHSVAYAMLAYKTAYLKAHYPLAFMAAMLTSEMASKDNVAKYVQECRAMGIDVQPPDINESGWNFAVVNKTIRYGLGAVKGIGEGAVEVILENRRRVGRFDNMTRFACEIDLKAVNHKVFESLIKAGCFDAFGAHRRALLESLDRILGFAQQRRTEQEQGQSTLFSGNVMPEPAPDPACRAWPERERLRLEKEVLGIYLTGNPLSEHEGDLRRLATHTTAGAKKFGDGKVIVGGIVTRVRQAKIKNGPNAGRMMGRFVLEDLEGTLPVTVFADHLKSCGSCLNEEAIVIVEGLVRERGAGVEMTLEQVTPLDEARRDLLCGVELIVSPATATSELVRLRDVLIEHPGPVPVCLCIRWPDRSVRIDVSERLQVRCDEALSAAIELILGQGSVRELYTGAAV